MSSTEVKSANPYISGRQGVRYRPAGGQFRSVKPAQGSGPATAPGHLSPGLASRGRRPGARHSGITPGAQALAHRRCIADFEMQPLSARLQAGPQIVEAAHELAMSGIVGTRCEAAQQRFEVRDLTAPFQLGRQISGILEQAIGSTQFGRDEWFVIQRQAPAGARKIVEFGALARLRDLVQ